jgi:hypothetical protein
MFHQPRNHHRCLQRGRTCRRDGPRDVACVHAAFRQAGGQESKHGTMGRTRGCRSRCHHRRMDPAVWANGTSNRLRTHQPAVLSR